MKLFGLSDPRKLWRRYTVGVLLLAALLLGSHGLHVKIINSGINDAEIVDLSGRQRMLSQRISGLVLVLDNDREQPLVVAELEKAVDQFATAHNRLIAYADGVPLASDIYSFGSSEGLDRRSRDFIERVHQFLSTTDDTGKQSEVVVRIQSDAFSVLLSDLDRAVKAFSADSKMRIEELENYQTLALCFALLLLVAESILIFLPAHRSVVSSLKSAEEKTDQLIERNSELQSISDRLSYAANHDHLTGLANRKKLFNELSRMLDDRHTNKKHLCIMHIDLDRFKEVNDTLGHPIGDNVICRAAETMQSRVRNTDLVARVGGDEFVIVLNIDDRRPIERAHRIAEGIIDRIKQPMNIDGHTCSIGASIGYIFASGANDSTEDLMANADIALYAAKKAGRGKAVHFISKMRRDIEVRHALMQDLEHAIEGNEFVPFFQPKINLNDGSLAGFEVLVRWLHPNRGILPPSEFLELAEESNLVGQIDLQVITGGLDGLTKLREEGWKVPSISINTSGHSLRSTNFINDLSKAVEIRKLSAGDVKVEVLESILISDSDDKAFQSIQNLSERGFKIDIDDFGTGYASLSVLSELQLSGLKVDRSLTQKIDDTRTRMVIDAIIGLSQRMELEITVEGVETTAQYAHVKSLGCHYAQGYGLGIPMSLEDARVWLNNYGRNKALKAVG